MSIEAIIGLVADKVFNYALESYKPGDEIRDLLGRNPQKMAFKVALEEAFEVFEPHYPQWVESLFNEYFLQNRAAPVLAKCLTRDGPPKGVELAEAWANQFDFSADNRKQRVSELTPVASDFLRWFDEALRQHDEFQPLFDSRAKDVTAKATLEASIAMIQTAEAAQKMASTLETLPEELAHELSEKFFEKMTQLIPSAPTAPQITITNPPALPQPPEISEDGQPVAANEPITQPLESFDLEGFLAQLDAPGGGVRLRDKLYVERAADAELRRELLKWGSTTTIHAPRQTGKTSLLVRGLHYAKKEGAKVVWLHFESLSEEQLRTPEVFLRTLAELICRNLRLNSDKVGQAWQEYGNAQQKLTYFLEDHVLPTFDGPIILAMDHADSLLKTNFHDNFFGLVRSWHDRRAFEPELWEKLNIVLAISTEPYLLINDINQSPFNVGLKITLADFRAEQVQTLNQQHGFPVKTDDFAHFMTFLGGQPYLTRQALYKLLMQNMSWGDLVGLAASDDGPFGSHLREMYAQIRDAKELKRAFKQIIRTSTCTDDESCFRLLRAGLIKRRDTVYSCRCKLYKHYFERKLS